MISRRAALAGLAALVVTSCVADFSVPQNAQVDCGADDDCPDGMRCSVSRGRCVGLYDELPSVEVAPVARSTGIVSLELLIIDAESEAVNLLAELDTGDGFVPVSIFPSTFASSPEGAPALLHWDAAATFGSAGYRPQVTLRLTPSEPSGSGNSVTRSFAFGNDPPVVDEVRVDDATVSGMTVVRFRAHDSSSDRLTVDTLELALSGDFSDAVTIPLETGVGAHLPSGELSGLTSPASGEPSGAIWHSFAWSSELVAPRESDGARLRLSVRDELGGRSAAVATPVFTIDNANTLPVVTLASTPTVTVTSTATLTYVIEDGDLDLCSVRVEYSIDGVTWSIAASASPTTGIVSGPPASRFDWEASSLPPGLYSNARLRLRASDGRGWSEPVTTPPFIVDTRLKTPPVVEMLSLGADVANRPLTSVQLELALSDAESDPVALTVEYQVGPSGPWRPATIEQPQSGYPAPAAGAPTTLFWDILADAGQAPLLPAELATSSDGASSRTIAAGVADVRLRITPVDGQQVSGGTAVSLPFLLGNTAPLATLAPLPAEVSGAVPVQLTLSDEEGDLADIVLEFRQDDADAWRRAAVSLGTETGLASSSAASGGRTYVLIWNSSAKLNPDPAAPQGVGTQLLAGARLRVQGSDVVNGTRFFGPASDATEPFTIRNQTPPRLADLRAPRSDTSTGHSPVGIVYRAIDAESDPVDVLIEYSFDLGSSWERCREYVIAESEGTVALASAPDDDVGRGGVEHRFFWDPTGTSLGQVDTTWIRIHATDGKTVARDPVVLRLGGPVAPPLVEPNVTPFALPVEEGPCAGPRELAAGDFDEDGVSDLAVVCNESGTVGVLQGQATDGVPNGDFAAAWTTERVAEGPDALTVADLDKDGHLDVALVDFTGGKIVVLKGDGSGHLTLLETYTVCAEPVGLAHADFNGDSDLDLVVSCLQESESLWYLEGTGSPAGGLFAPVPLADFSYPRSVEAADLNLDGAMDIVVGGSVLRGAGDGTFQFAGDFAPGRANNHAIADLNLDGRMDVVGTLPGLNRIVVALGQATGGFFAEATEYVVDSYPEYVVVADFSGDSVPDIVVTTETHGPRILVQGQMGGRPTGQFSGSTSLPQAGQTTWLLAGDFNSDRYSDLVVSNMAGPFVFLSRASTGLGAGSFGEAMLYPGFPSNGGRAADLDADGLLDAVSLGVLTTFRGAGSNVPSGTFGQPTRGFHGKIDIYGMGGGNGGAIEDFNADGNEDLAYADYWSTPESLSVFTSTGGAWQGATSYQVHRYDCAGCSGLTQVVSGDFDGDDVLDLAGDLREERQLGVWLGLQESGKPLGTFAPIRLFDTGCPPGGEQGTSGLAADDFNGDGRDDIAVACIDAAAIFLATGDRTAPFAAAQRYPIIDPTAAASTQGILASDLNTDGILDLLVNTRDAVGTATLVLLLGKGTSGVGDGTFGAWSISALDGSADTFRDCFAADVTRDGVMDLVAVGTGMTIFPGLNQRGRGGSYSTGSRYLSGTLRAVAPGDFNGDAVLDLLVSSDGGLGLMPGQYETLLGTWSQPLQGPASAGFGLVGAQVHAAGTDLFGRPLPLPSLSRHRFQIERGGSLVDFGRGLRRSGLPLPASLVPLTHAWDLGDERFLRHAVAPDGRLRWQVASRFGRRLGPDEASPLRAGFDLSAEGLDNQTGVVVELPVIDATTDAELDGAVQVRVFRRTLDWLRSAELPADSLQHPDWLPQVADLSDPTGRRDLIRRRPKWTEIPVDVDGDLSTGTGARFVVVRKGGKRVVRVLTDHLGLFGAYLQMLP